MKDSIRIILAVLISASTIHFMKDLNHERMLKADKISKKYLEDYTSQKNLPAQLLIHF